MKAKVISLILALVCVGSLFAQNNVITYIASKKLTEVSAGPTVGLHKNAFNVYMSSHTFSDGQGTITFSGEVTTIGMYAFYGCAGLTSITIPDSVTSIGERAFSNCLRLSSITLGNSVNLIGNYAFYNCPCLTSITIPNSVTSIGDYAFCHCYGLTSVSIGNSVNSIGCGAFGGCSNLSEIYCSAEQPPFVDTCDQPAFDNYEGYLHVSCDCLAAYQADAVWGQFKNMICEDVSAIEDVTSSVSNLSSDGKFFRDGHIYILRDGHIYTATGAKVE